MTLENSKELSLKKTNKLAGSYLDDYVITLFITISYMKIAIDIFAENAEMFIGLQIRQLKFS